MNPERQIHAVVNAFVDNVTVIARHIAVHALTAAFGEATKELATTGRIPARPGSSRAVGLRLGEKRAPADLARLSARFLEYVEAHPGLRIEEINRALGTRTAELRGPVTKLVRDGDVATKGRRRAMTYYASRVVMQRRPADVLKKRSRRRKRRR